MKQRFHLTGSFVLYVVLLSVVVLVAMHTQYNFLFWLMGLMSGLMFVSFILVWRMIRATHLHRLDPSYGAVGAPLTIRYRVTNKAKRLPLLNLNIQEKHAIPPVDDPTSTSWQNVMDAVRTWIMHVGPQGDAHAETVLWPHQRGRVVFDTSVVSSSFPFGILRRSKLVSRPQHTLIFPQLYYMRQDVMHALAPGGPIGMRMSQSAGGGDEFFGVREYRPGDSRRAISWKLSARRDDLICIERTLPSPPKLRVLLDLSTPTNELIISDDDQGARTLEEHAISLAGSIVRAAHEQGMEVGLSIAGQNLPPIPVRHSAWHLGRMLAALAMVHLDGERPRPTHRLAPDAERAGMVVVHPSRIDPSIGREDALHLSARRMEELTSGSLGWDPSRVRTRPVTDGETNPGEEVAA